MIRKILFALCALAWAQSSVAQTTGNLQPGQILGNPLGTAAPARGALPSAFGINSTTLFANRIYFVRTDGSNTLCNGLTDAAAAAAPNCSVASWQTAVNLAKTYNLNSFSITLQHGPLEAGPRTFNECVNVPMITASGGGGLIVSGNGPTRTLFAATCGDPWGLINTLVPVQFQNAKFTSTTGSGIFNVQQLSRIVYGSGLDFGSAAFAHLYIHDGSASAFILGSTYTISGGTNYHISCVRGGKIFYEGNTVTLTGTPPFSVFALVQGGCDLRATESSPGVTFIGAATGQRYLVTGPSTISPSPYSETFFPGNAAGQAPYPATYEGAAALNGFIVANGPVSPIAVRTSLGIFNNITDPTGSGALVFAASPTLSGVPLSPTAAANTNTTQIATTAFVNTAIRVVKKQVFTSSGTYTPSTGIQYAIIECLGAGGGGGGVANAGATATNNAQGGGAGSYSRTYASAASIGASQTVTIGAAGAAGASGANAGGNGGDTSVGSLCIGKGGSGGGTTTGSPGAGGVAGTGDFTATGAPGFSMMSYSTTIAFTAQYTAPGGSSVFGGGAISLGTGTTSAGAAATGYGSGGGGASSINASGANAGGAGTAGVVIVTEYTNQ